MTIVLISLSVLILAVIMHFVGKFWLAYYGFKYNAGLGIGVILIDFVTFWFAFYKLEKEGKEKAATLWLLGTVLALVMIGGFYQPIMDGLTGKAFAEDYLKPPAPAPTPVKKEQTPKEEANNTATPDSAGTTTATEGGTTTTTSTTDGAAPTEEGKPAEDGKPAEEGKPTEEGKAPEGDKAPAADTAAEGSKAPEGDKAPEGGKTPEGGKAPEGDKAATP